MRGDKAPGQDTLLEQVAVEVTCAHELWGDAAFGWTLGSCSPPGLWSVGEKQCPGFHVGHFQPLRPHVQVEVEGLQSRMMFWASH